MTESGTAGINAYVQLEITPETLGAGTVTGTAGVPTLYYYCPIIQEWEAMENSNLIPSFLFASGDDVSARIAL